MTKHGQQRAAIQDAAQSGESAPARSLLAAAETAEEARPSELERLAERAQAGDMPAREELVERMLPTIGALARSYRTEGLDQADLVQEGIVGLLRALARYEPVRGTPFPAWAAWWIRQALQEARSDFIRPLRLPPAALRQLAQLKAEHERIYASEHRDASVEELAARVQVEGAQAQALLRAGQRPRSLDEPVEGAEGEVGSLGALLADPLSRDAYEDVLDSIAGEQLRALLTRLTEREREIVDARFGFGRPSERLVEIGDRLGISAERVRQLEERALAKLRQAA